MPKKRIPHIIDDDGIEKKLCSNCKQYKPLDEYNFKADRWDRLSNECFICLSLRNKKRHDHTFKFPDNVTTRAEAQEFLDLCRYRKCRDVEQELKNKEEYHGLEIQKENKHRETPDS